MNRWVARLVWPMLSYSMPFRASSNINSRSSLDMEFGAPACLRREPRVFQLQIIALPTNAVKNWMGTNGSALVRKLS